MALDFGHDQMESALQRCGASWDAAQSHGLLAGLLLVGGDAAGPEWMQRVLADTDPANALRADCERMLGELLVETCQQLTERQSEFAPLLPDDGDPMERRATALAHWSEGFLHGLVSTDAGDAVRKRLAEEPLADIIRDLLQITRAASDDAADDEINESAYVELVEYLRVTTQLAYEELAGLRPRPPGSVH